MPLKALKGLPAINASTRRIITLLLRSGPMPRVELARRLSLTPAALTKLTRQLLEIGVLKQVERPETGSTGRPAQPLAVDPCYAAFVGVKLTGDHAYAVLTDLAGTVLEATATELGRRDSSSVCEKIIDLVNNLRCRSDAAGVGISLAGPVIRARGHVVSSPFLGWEAIDLAAELEPRLGVPVVVENDLRALTTAQHWFDDTLTSFALVTFGAGIGCGLVLDDRLVNGSSGAAGLIDHLRIDDHGPMCARGHRGCVSSYATTASILRAAGQQESTGSPQQLAEVGASARQGDQHASAVLHDAGYAIGCVIGTVCNVTGPGRVILSGEGAELYDTLEESLRCGIATVMHPVLQPIPVTVARLSFTDWARGAAVVAIQHHLELRSAPY